MMNRARELWEQHILNFVQKSISGVWPGGSQYSYNTFYFSLAFVEAEITSTSAKTIFLIICLLKILNFRFYNSSRK